MTTLSHANWKNIRLHVLDTMDFLVKAENFVDHTSKHLAGKDQC